MDLTYVLTDEVVLVTTKERADTELFAAVYPVGDLVGGRSSQDVDALIETITTAVKPQTWDEVGGPGAAGWLASASCLVLNQTHDVHEEIARLLDRLRKLRSDVPAPLPPPAPAPPAKKTGGGMF
jgi:hypothetical protein